MPVGHPLEGRPGHALPQGDQAEDLSGELLNFATEKGETIVIVPKGSTPAPQ